MFQLPCAEAAAWECPIATSFLGTASCAGFLGYRYMAFVGHPGYVIWLES